MPRSIPPRFVPQVDEWLVRPLIQKVTEWKREPALDKSVPWEAMPFPPLRRLLPLGTLLRTTVAVRGAPEALFDMLPENDPFPEDFYRLIPVTDHIVERARAERPSFMVHVLRRAPLEEEQLGEFLSRLSSSSIEAIVLESSRIIGEGAQQHRWLMNLTDRYGKARPVLARRAVALGGIVAHPVHGSRELFLQAEANLRPWEGDAFRAVGVRVSSAFKAEVAQRLPAYLVEQDLEGLLPEWHWTFRDSPRGTKTRRFLKERMAGHQGVTDETFAWHFAQVPALTKVTKGRDLLDEPGFEKRVSSPAVMKHMLRLGVRRDTVALAAIRAHRLGVPWREIFECLQEQKDKAVSTAVIEALLEEMHDLRAEDLVPLLGRPPSPSPRSLDPP